MLNKEQTGLEIFDNFIVDQSLPKYNNNQSDLAETGSMRIWNSMSPMSSGIFLNSADGTISLENHISETISKSLWIFKFGWIKKIFQKFNSQVKEWKKISVNDFFKHVKNTSEEISIIENRKEAYIKAIESAKKFGQIALVEKLEKMVEVVRNETQLLSLGLDTIISEDQIINFYKKAKTGLKLTWIKNYIRFIPTELLEIKDKCDQLEIFDNYVILHYDPHGKSFAMTQKEIEKAKDPILFGLIKDSRKLYYLGDWIDDCCNLTIEAFIDKFGEEALEKISSEIKIKC